MLYPKNTAEKLSGELFRNPGTEYRGAPFWAWNCRLKKDLLLREIDQLREMGFGGFHIHCRSGLDTEYMGSEFLQLVDDCDRKAKDRGMLCWLYDEDRWPSGAGGGLVTKDRNFRMRYLVFSPPHLAHDEPVEYDSSARAPRNPEDSRILARYEIELRDGFLRNYRRMANGETAADPAKVWTAALEISAPSPWFNNQTYVDTLNPKAIARFVEVTHERYAARFRSEFGHSIPAIFTDEPQFTHKQTLDFADARKEVLLPFTDDFEETYRRAYGESILDRLPELFWDLPGGRISQARYHYHDHVSERFTQAFADTIGSWCASHGIMLTGHMMEEPTLESQTAALGECMRSYRSFQLPGIDMLCDRREFTTAKQAASAAHQYGCPGVLSELYGVTNWDFDFRGHKLQGDWQAALGVTVRVPHLSWVSMEGEAKRDYPASIGYQSPWYREYPLIENHFARLNTALTRGKPHVRVGVIHPVESYWLHWGPREQTAQIREELDANFRNITDWLLLGLIDFDFISESLLPSQARPRGDGRFGVGEMGYDAVVVPGCETLRSTTLEQLRRFRNAGGKVIFAGEPAACIDAAESGEVREFAAGCETVPFTRAGLLQALEPCRDIDIREEDGAKAGGLLYQLREDSRNAWLFVCHAYPMENPDLAHIENIRIRIRGGWRPTIYDTMNGRIVPCPASVGGGWTDIRHSFSQHDSLLLLLEPLADGQSVPSAPVVRFPDLSRFTQTLLPQPDSVALSEPNVLLLDMAEYAFDGGSWQPADELLHVDNAFRRLLGYPLRMQSLAQPWVEPPEEAPAHRLSLRFVIDSDVEVTGARLAVERPRPMQIFLGGAQVSSEPDGWFTDESIRTVPLPAIPAGRTELVLHIPFTRKTNVEWCYLLGNFRVSVAGRFARITGVFHPPVFGDWVPQGMPFYAGNTTYTSTFASPGGRALLEVSHFRNPLLAVSLDGSRRGVIAFAPYFLDLGGLSAGAHTLAITAYGNRVNAFGAVHNSNFTNRWHGPNAWRSTGASWSYEYQLRPTGILTTPRLWLEK